MTLFHYKVFKERSVTENEHERMLLSVDPCMVTSQNYLVFVVILCILSHIHYHHIELTRDLFEHGKTLSSLRVSCIFTSWNVEVISALICN